MGNLFTNGLKRIKNTSISKKCIIFLSLFASFLIITISSTAFANRRHDIIVPTISEIEMNGYPVNQNGETYGPDLKNASYTPDLILAENSSGILGYIKKAELNDQLPQSPQNTKMRMYTEDGDTIIGYFELACDN